MSDISTPETAPLARAVGRNTLIQFFGKIIGTVIGLTTSVFILRYLHPSGNGEYTTAMAYAGFFSVIADLGLYLILVRDMNKPGANQERIVGNLLALRWVSALIILGVGVVSVFLFHFTWTEKIAVMIVGGSFIAVAATQLLVGIFQTHLKMVYVTAAELAGRLVLLTLVWLVVRAHASLWGVMWAVVAGSLVNLGIILLTARKFVRLRLYADWPYWASTLRDTFPIAVSIVLNLIYFRADTIILRLYHGTYDVGLYGAAYKILEILNTFPIMFVGLLLPALGAAFASAQRERFQAVFQKGFELLLLAVVPMLIGGWLLARPVLLFIGGADYAPAAPVLRLLLVAVGALFLGSLSGHTVTIINRQRQMVWSYLAVAVVGLAVYFTLIPRWSFYGAAIGTILTETLTAIVGYVVITRVLQFRLSLNTLPRLALLAAAMVVVGWVAQPLGGWWPGVLSLLTYGALMFMTRLITTSQLREILSRRSAAVEQLPE